MKKGSISKFSVITLADIVLLSGIFLFLFAADIITANALMYFLPLILVFSLIKTFAIVGMDGYFSGKKLDSIRKIIGEFKKGRYAVPRYGMLGNDELAQIYRELTIIGKHIDDIVSTQKNEISQLREMYNNTILSMSSYFLVLNEERQIVFANESFCRKFQYDQEELYGLNIDEVFFFLTNQLKESLDSLNVSGESVVIEKTHLLSRNRISVIADVKISRMLLQGKTQLVLVIDDITSRCRKDYQISLISQISESIQRDEEIDQVLYTILTGVTSGSGLGFNRAVLFLIDESGKALVGKMAVGPDSLEEAIEIWNSIPAGRVDIFDQLKNFNKGGRKGQVLLDTVMSARFPIKSGNIFVKSMENIENIHVYDSYRDERVDKYIREFMDVNEFVVVPLVAGNKAIGIIVADNKYNQMPISRESIELLSVFAFQTALSIESYNNLTLLRKEMQKITDRQDAIVESEKLAAVGRIASHIAHEIRNPLVTMGGYARRVLQLSREAAKNEIMIKNAAGVILKESERLEKVLSNVMDFTRPSPYIQEFNNINDIINDTIDLLRNLFQERKLKVALKLQNDIPLVKSDFNQLKQVMLNLLQNAIDATPPDGKIEIITEVDHKNVTICVADSGTGIHEEDIYRVFDPFFTTKVTGVGLGLAIVRKVVTDHGGEIMVSKRPEGGTEFKIVLAIP